MIGLLLEEWVHEEGWRISRKFMREIERELDIKEKVPVVALLNSNELYLKWMEFVGGN